MDFIRSFIESYLPPNYSAHGHHVDNLIIWTHYLMFVLFVGWGIYFIYTLFKFRASNNSKAHYKGVTSHYSTYVEGGVIIFEAFLIFGSQKFLNTDFTFNTYFLEEIQTIFGQYFPKSLYQIVVLILMPFFL